MLAALKREIVGLTEIVKINGKEVTAKIDTGAKYNSICRSLASRLNFGPPVKTITIKSSTGKECRPMVEAEIEIKGKKIKTFFNIANRQHMEYNVLIGSDLLKREAFLVDPKK